MNQGLIITVIGQSQINRDSLCLLNMLQLYVSPSKCCVLSVGKVHSVQPKLFVSQNSLPVVNSCVDLVITVTSELTHRIHINNIVAKAHKRGNAIHRCFESKNSSSLLRAFLVYVRPILEHNSILWSPHYKQDIEAIECVQRRFTKRLPGLHSCTYSERLKTSH